MSEYGAEGEVRLPSLGPRGWARWAWRQLTSMRTALMLLVLLAVAAVPGSVWPQRRTDPGLVSDYLLDHPTAGAWLDRLGVFDVYTSPWFSAIYLLLFVSLVGCVLPRARTHARALRTPPPATPSRLDRLPAHAARPLPAPVGTSSGGQAVDEAVAAAAERVLRARRFRVRRHDRAHSRCGLSVAAETGYLSETGNLVFHLALVGLLGALAWGSLGTYSGQVTLVEGRTFANVVTSYDSFTASRLVEVGELAPFTVRLDSLDVAFESDASGTQLGAARRFDAQLTVTDRPGATPRAVTVSPNRPLDVAGTRAFLVGNGYAPAITVRGADGEVAFRGPVTTRPMDGNYKSVIVLKVPDAVPRQIGLAGVFLPTYDTDADGIPVSLFPDTLNPRLVLQVYVAEPGEDGLGVNTGVPQSVFRLDTRSMTRLSDTNGTPLQLVLAPGATSPLPDGAGSVTFDGYARFAALDIRRDPSRVWALAFASLALAGLTASLFVRRRRIWVRAGLATDADLLKDTDGGGITVEAGGLARRDDPDLAGEVDAVLDQVVAALTGTAAAARAPADGPVTDRAAEPEAPQRAVPGGDSTPEGDRLGSR